MTNRKPVRDRLGAWGAEEFVVRGSRVTPVEEGTSVQDRRNRW